MIHSVVASFGAAIMRCNVQATSIYVGA